MNSTSDIPLAGFGRAFHAPAAARQLDVAALSDARDFLAGFLAKLQRWNPGREPDGPRCDMVGLGDDVKHAVSRVLGEGEVSAQIGGESVWHVQESVFTGVWRCCQYNGASTLVADWLEAARLPRIVLAAARATPPPGLAPARMPLELKGAPGLIREIRSTAAAYRPGIRAHVFNLTLAPMGVEDYFALEQAFPAGPVAITSLGFGNCRIMSTAARDVWRVQYFNNVNALILDTIEVVGVPELALASADDLVDSRSRLAELIAWMTESNGERVAV